MDWIHILLLSLFIILIIQYIYVTGVNLPFLIFSSACIYLFTMDLWWNKIKPLILDKIRSMKGFPALLYETIINLILIAYPTFATYIYFKYRGDGLASLFLLIIILASILASLIDHFLKNKKR